MIVGYWNRCCQPLGSRNNFEVTAKEITMLRTLPVHLYQPDDKDAAGTWLHEQKRQGLAAAVFFMQIHQERASIAGHSVCMYAHE